MIRQRLSELSFLGIPKPDGAVPASRGQRLVIRRKGKGYSVARMSFQESQTQFFRDRPECNIVLRVRGCQDLAVMGKGCRSVKFILLRRAFEFKLLAADIPDPGFAIRAGRG